MVLIQTYTVVNLSNIYQYLYRDKFYKLSMKTQKDLNLPNFLYLNCLRWYECFQEYIGANYKKMQSSVAPKTVDQPHRRLQQQNKPINFLQNWAKTTKARFGLKLYTFMPKKTIQVSCASILIKQQSPEQPIDPPIHEAKQQSKRTNYVNTPERKKQREKRVRTTHAKSDSQSSQYHPNKKAKLQRKREEKARQAKSNPVKKVLFE